MATALTAQGIGFSGAPREYTGIVMQRNRQKQLDEQAAKEKQDKEYDKLYEQINIKDPTKFFSFDLQDIKRTTAETIDKLAKAKASGNYSEAQKITSDYSTTMDSYEQQKIDYDAKVKTGKNIFEPDLINFENSPSREEAAKRYGQSEGVAYAPENNQFRFNAIPNFDDQKLFTDIAKDKNVFKEGKIVERLGPYGQIIQEQQYEINPEAYDARLKNAIQDPQIYAAEAAKYRIKNPKWREETALDFQQNVIDSFIERGRSFQGIPFSKTKAFKPKGDYTNNITINTGNQEPISGVVEEVAFNVKQPDLNGMPQVMEVKMKKVSAFGDVKASLPNSDYTYDFNGNKRVQKPGVTPITYNQVGIAAVAKRDVKYPGITFTKGQIIPQKFLDNFPNEVSKENIEYSAIAVGLDTENGNSVYTQAALPSRSSYYKLSEKEKADGKKAYEMQGEIENLNSTLKEKSVKSQELKPQSKATTPAPAPKAAAKPAAVKDESRDIPSSGTRTREERVKANPKLKNLPK